MNTEQPGNAALPEGKPSAADVLLRIGKEADLFRNERGEAFARFPVGGHWEIRPIRSKAFTDWLSVRYFDSEGKPPPSDAVSCALSVLAGIASYQGEEHRLWVRVAPGHESVIWYDLADADWRAVRVDAQSWGIAPRPPILFRRHAPLAAQPTPLLGTQHINWLREFLHVDNEDDWRLLVTWMVASMMPSIAHPVLVIHGEQGSSKSTTARILGSLIDPSAVPLRAEPRDIAEWIQAADHSWLITLDNVSRLPGWLSDALCRTVTGEAFLTRTLYTNEEDSLAEFRRVVILTGVDSMVTRPDLLDRSILLRLEPISAEKRKSETALIDAFERDRPGLVGALLTLVSGVLKELPKVKETGLPRMADFARVGIALEEICSWPKGSFREAHVRNSGHLNDEAITASPIGEILLDFSKDFRASTQDASYWEGTASELLWEMGAYVKKGRPQNWPRDARAMTVELRRLAPNLRPAGIQIEFMRTAARRVIRVVRWRGV